MRTLVVGGGISGLTAGIALRRAGHDVTVFEKAAELEQVRLGTGLHIWPNAMKAFKQLEVDEAVHAVGMEEIGRAHV